MAANNIYIQVDLNATGAQANINALNNALALSGPVSQKAAQQTTTALNTVQVSVSQTTKAFEELTQAMAGIGIMRLAQNIIDVGTQLNRAQQAMAAFTGSAEVARDVTEQIRAIAAQSPFAFKDLEEGARRLAGFGVQAKEIPTWMKIISDQAAAMGGSIEDVNNIVTLFGRVLEKNVVGAMDIMRKLPGEGVNVQKALTAALGRQQVGATFDDVKKAIKEGALDPLVTLRTLLGAMQEQTGGAGARMNDFAMIMKNVGDALDRAKELLLGEKGFGPALRTLGHEIEVMLAPLAGFIKLLTDLPEPMKVLLVNLVAGAGAVIAFGGAWKIFATIASPAITVMQGLAGALTESLIPALLNPEILIAIAAIGTAVFALTKIFPETTQKFLTWASDLWHKLKDKARTLVEQSGLLPPSVKQEDLQKGGNLAVETKENLEAVQKQVQEWADSAGHTMLNALSSPAEAVLMKYKTLFDKLNEEIKDKFIAPDNAQRLLAQLGAAQQMEMNAKILEQKKQDNAEYYKGELERAKSAYDAQILYIEAQDAQSLRGKVAAIDKITALRKESSETTARLETKQLEDDYNAQIKYLNDYKDEFTKAGIDVEVAQKRLRAEVDQKQKNIDQKAVDEAQKYRLEGWKKANDAIIEDQKRVYEAFQSMFDDIFEAFTQRTKSIGQALGDVFKKLALGELRNLFSSQMASMATQAAGYGQPEDRIRRSGGILGVLLQRGMPPRPAMEAPEGYNPAKAESALSFGSEVGGAVNTANREIANAGGVYNVSAIVFSNAVNKFAAVAQSHEGSADRMAESSATISEASDAIQQASAATGVSPSLLRSVAQVESGPRMRTDLTSSKGAQGLFQLMPATQQDWGVTQPFNPYQSAMGGAQQLNRLITRYGGDVPTAVAAYNWGPGNVDRALAAGRPFPRQVQNYVLKVMGGIGAQQTPGRSLIPELTGGAQLDQLANLPMRATPAALTLGGMVGGYGQYGGGGGGFTGGADIDDIGAATGTATMPTIQELASLPGQASAIQRLAPLFLAGLKGIGSGTGAGSGGINVAGFKIPTLANLRAFFGLSKIATAAGLGGIAKGLGTSPAMGMLATMGGMALVSKGLQQYNAPATAIGGGMAGIGAVLSSPQLMAKLATHAGGLGVGLAGAAATGIGAGIFASGVQRGGGGGLAMDIGGGALAGAGIGTMILPGLGTAIGAAIGAGVGAITGIVRLFVHTETERIRTQIKQVYGVDISNRQILAQVKQIVDQKYGGNVSIGIRSQDVQDIVRLYALSTGQAAGLPRPMYSATVAQSTQGMQLQPVYQGGTQVANPYSGPTTYQYQSAVANAQGLMPGTSLGVPGASGIISNQWQAMALQTIQGNPGAIGMANAAAATAGDSRLTTTQAMQEPLTALS